MNNEWICLHDGVRERYARKTSIDAVYQGKNDNYYCAVGNCTFQITYEKFNELRTMITGVDVKKGYEEIAQNNKIAWKVK